MNNKLRFLAMIPVILMGLSACNLSLASDITPPPNYQSPTPAPTLGPVYPPAPPDSVAGKAIYAEKCAACHGPTGKGDGEQGQALPVRVAAIGLPEVARPAAPADWFAIVSQGNLERYMPPFQSLNEQQRWDVLAYVRSLSTAAEAVEQGRQVYATQCVKCHGADGRGVTNVQFTDQALMAKLSDQNLFDVISMGIEPSMPAYSGKLDEDSRWALVAYVRSLTFAAAQPAAAADQSTPTPESVSTGEPAPTSEAANGSTPEATATPQGLGVVSGTVTNGSGSGIPSGLTVKLGAFEHDPATGGFNPVKELTAPVGANGSFTFENVEMPTNRAFLATIEYQGVQYNSQPAIAAEGQNELEMPVTIYETSTDISALTVSRWHIFVNFTPDGQSVQIIEAIIVSNNSTRTVAPAADGKPLLTYPLPAGAENLQYDDTNLPGRFVPGQNSVGDLAPVLPGMEQDQVVIIYTLPYKGKLSLTRSLPLGADAVLVLVPQGVNLKSDFLTKGESRDYQGTTFDVYNGSTLPAQGQLSFAISGRPGGMTSFTNATDIPSAALVGVGLLGLAMIVVAVYLYVRERRQAMAIPAETGEAEFEDAESVLDAIIAVDDLHRAGKIPDEAYQERRDELKAKLKDLMGE